MNTLANTLKAEERAKLKLNDVSYQPKPVKPLKHGVNKKPPNAKLDKVELKKYALELSQFGISESVLQMVCVSKNYTPEQAAGHLRRALMEAKSESAS